jgi:adenylate cyclase
MTSNRTLAAILAADAAGYARLMSHDEAATVAALNRARGTFRERIEAHGGKLIDTAGDSVLAEFRSVVEALQCASEVQDALRTANDSSPEDRRMLFRIGINLGDVIEEGGGLYGDGVNVAARLQQLAEPGGICVSGTAFDQIEGKTPLDFQFVGEQEVKNIPRPLRVYRLSGLTAGARGQPKPSAPRRTGIKLPGIALATVALVGTLAVVAITLVSRQDQRQTTVAQDAALAMPTGPAIAVLPFNNMSGDPKDDYFSDGLTEDIITELARFPELHVLARNTTFQYKNQAVDVAAVGRSLAVRYVLEGSVRRTNDRVRINAQLIDATSGAHAWAARYDRPLKDIFAVQDEITGKVVASIAGGLGGVLQQARREIADRKKPQELEAYDLVLRAAAMPYSPEGYREAKAFLQRAIELDANYARARHEYAWLMLIGWIFRLEPTPAPPDEIKQNAILAVQLDPNDPLAHRTAAYGYFFDHKLAAFEKEAATAFELAPYNPEVFAHLGMAIAFTGQWERGVKLVTKADTLNQASSAGWSHSAWFYDLYRKGRFREAIDVIRQHPGQQMCETQMKYVAAYGQLHEPAKAKEHLDNCRAHEPEFSPETVQDILRLWNFQEPFIRSFIDGFAKAGFPCKNPGCTP